MKPRHFATLACAALSAQAAVAQRDWAQVPTTATPSAQLDFDLAFDLGRARTVLFGGRDTGGTHYAETWEFDGTTWVLASPAASPSPRVGFRMAYDPVAAATVLFGGFTSANLDETWTWNGANWTLHTPSVSPPPRHAHAMWYDAARQRVVVFGGSSNGTLMNDTWAWNGAAWTQLSPANSPPARFATHAAYDFHRDRAVLFGGAENAPTGGLRRLDDTWEFDGLDWTQVTTPNGPTPRWGHKVAYDFGARRVVMFGGNTGGFSGGTWEYDGWDWHTVSTLATPSGRDNHSMTYDIVRDRAVIFGGFPPGHDTWEYFDQSPARFARFGTGCTGAAGIPSLDATPGSVPLLGGPLTLEVTSLAAGTPAVFGLLGITPPTAIDLGVIGMNGCVLFLGAPFANALPLQAGRATWALNIPNDPSLRGGVFHVQAIVVDASANRLGLILSNAGAGTIG